MRQDHFNILADTHTELLNALLWHVPVRRDLLDLFLLANSVAKKTFGEIFYGDVLHIVKLARLFSETS